MRRTIRSCAKGLVLSVIPFSMALIFTGCAATLSHQIGAEHRQLRDVVMEYVDDQIIDNLIRASHGLAIAHLDFSHVNATASLKISPQVGGGRTVARVSNKMPNQQTTSSTTTAPGGVTTVVGNTLAAIGGVVETVTRPFTYGASADTGGGMSVEVNPVLNSPRLYLAYVRFLMGDDPMEKGPTSKSIATRNMDGTVTIETSDEGSPPRLDFDKIASLQRTITPPPANAVIAKKWRDGWYYWVPAEYKDKFFRLCLATVIRTEAQSPNKAARDIESTLRQQQFLNNN
jgi:hypothetical protein